MAGVISGSASCAALLTTKIQMSGSVLGTTNLSGDMKLHADLAGAILSGVSVYPADLIARILMSGDVLTSTRLSADLTAKIWMLGNIPANSQVAGSMGVVDKLFACQTKNRVSLISQEGNLLSQGTAMIMRLPQRILCSLGQQFTVVLPHKE